MMANIDYLSSDESSPLPKGSYDIQSVFQKDVAILDFDLIIEKELAIHSIRVPRSLTSDRIFSHCTYFMERDAMTIPVKNAEQAYKVSGKVLMFL